MRIILLLAALAAAAPAQADQFTIQNKGDKPIYRLYGWPSDFMPRTQSLIIAPIPPGQQAQVEVENNWGRCEITFQADRNERSPQKMLLLRKQKIPFDIAPINWCNGNTRTVIMPPPDRPD